MPDKLINLDNLGRFKENLDVVLEDKADVDGVYSKTQADTLLGGKQDNLSATQLENINDVPNKQDAMDAISNDFVDLLFGKLAVDSTLANNPWSTIAAVFEAGMAGNYWAIGDTKTNVGTDSTTRTFRICDMSGMYGKHGVFEQVELEATAYVWNREANKDGDNAYNDYEISDVRKTVLPGVFAKYGSDLQSVITPTSYIVAENGTSSTLLTLSDKLFLPAEKEIFGSRQYSRQNEANALTWFALYAANDSNAFRVKNRSGSASSWWQRSPNSGYTNYVCIVYSNGGRSNIYANVSIGVAPCFAL